MKDRSNILASSTSTLNLNHVVWFTNRITSHSNIIMPSNLTVATQIAFALNCR